MVKTLKLERPKTELLTIMRWEDDGGMIIETNRLKPRPPFVQLPINTVLHNTSLPWSQQFVIEPFQADAGIRLIRRGAPVKK